MKSKILQARSFNLVAMVAFSLTALASNMVAQSRVPQFKDYPVSEAYIGRNAPPVLTRDDMIFRTRLRWATRNQKPNFAGRYILTTWGCGTSCIMGAVIDAKTGKVHWWNFSICCWSYDVDDNFQPIEFRLNSRLIVFSGARNEKEGDNGAHFYKFENGRFVHLRSVPKPEGSDGHSDAASNNGMHPTANSAAFVRELGCLIHCARGG